MNSYEKQLIAYKFDSLGETLERPKLPKLHKETPIT